MIEILEDFSTIALIAAIKTNLFEYFEYLGRSPRAELRQDQQLKGVLTGIPHSFLNNILQAQLNPDNVDAVIRQTLASCTERNITMLSWWTEKDSRPVDLGEHLISSGFKYTDGNPGMAVDLLNLNEVLLPANLTIKRVEDIETLREFVHAAVAGYGLPEGCGGMCFDLFAGLGFGLPLRNYVGYVSGEPFTTAELFLGAGAAGIYWVSTVPEARRQGFGAAITQAALQEARELGYCTGILHATEQGLEVYRRLGFVEYCQMSHYVWANEMS